MDLQRLVDSMNASSAATRADYHLTLGGLRDALDGASDGSLVLFSDGTPAGSFDSYRGYYTDISIEDGSDPKTVAEFREIVATALDHTFIGYKGGDYPATPKTPLWRSEYGKASGVAVTGFHEEIEARFILTTKQID